MKSKHDLQPTLLEISYARVTGGSSFHKGLLYSDCPYDSSFQSELRLSWSEGYNNARVQTARAERKA